MDTWAVNEKRLTEEPFLKQVNEVLREKKAIHGFDTFRRAVHINSWLRKNGYLELKNPYAESGA